jgi:molybdopterin converting factor small subunit
MSRIRVEFFGIPRQRAGIAETVLEFNGDEAIELRTLFRILTQQIPSLEGECLRDGQLSKGYIVNIDGQHFVSDSQGAVSDGAAVLIMSADAGG